MFERTVIKPQLDVPVVVRLDDGCEGLEKQNKHGVYYQYLANGNKDILFLPREGHDAIRRTAAKPGAEVEIVKSMFGKVFSYSAKLVSDAPTPIRTETPQNGNRHAHSRIKGHFPPRVYANPEPEEQPSQQEESEEKRPPEQAMPASSPTAQHLGKCFEAAIDAAVHAQEYARARGIGLTFLGSDIRSIADTIYIGDTRNGRQS